jgi:D-serine deaminase-like pyridoxal phosphate-dependent protein
VATESDALRARLDRATAHLDPPFAAIDLPAFDANATALAAQAGGKPIRVASKSVRCRALINAALAIPGWRGVLAYTLAEAVWLVRCGVTDDALVAYPTADRNALDELAGDPQLASAITVMVDSPAQLDLIDAVIAPNRRPQIRVCLDLDASWRPLGRRVHLGVRRSPVHSPAAAGALAAHLAGRGGFRLVGLMAYDAQIAGLGDAPPRQPLRSAAIRVIQRRSYRELLRRRAAAVAALRRHADHEFVNSGGTGSVAATSADRDRVERRLRALRAHAVRRLPRLAADARRVLRAAGGAPTRAPHRDRAGGRLDRVRTRGPEPVTHPVATGGAAVGAGRGRGRGADAGHRRRGRHVAGRGQGVVQTREGRGAV